MKLTKRVPTEPGLYWCWKEGKNNPVAHCVVERFCFGDGSSELFSLDDSGLPRYIELFTHYAGPISPPDTPEPVDWQSIARELAVAAEGIMRFLPLGGSSYVGGRIASLRVALDRCEDALEDER